MVGGTEHGCVGEENIEALVAAAIYVYERILKKRRVISKRRRTCPNL